jgi:hypothetical protein
VGIGGARPRAGTLRRVNRDYSVRFVVAGVGLIGAGLCWAAVEILAIARTGTMVTGGAGFPCGLAMVVAGSLVLVASRWAKKQFHWRAGLRRGVVRLSALRPGETDEYGQALVCTMEVESAARVLVRQDYRLRIGPLDAPRFVNGATLACEANPGDAGTVRVYPHDDPRAFRLTGRYIDCMAVA